MIGVMNDLRSTRATIVLGVVLCALVATVLIFPRVVDATTEHADTSAAQNPVELGSIGVPDENGGTLVCPNPSGFTGNTITWDCGETRILGRSEAAPANAATALARFYRAATLERNVDTSGVESPSAGVHVKRNNADGEDALVAVSVAEADGSTTQYFTFGGDKADEFSQRLISAAASGQEASK